MTDQELIDLYSNYQNDIVFVLGTNPPPPVILFKDLIRIVQLIQAGTIQ